MLYLTKSRAQAAAHSALDYGLGRLKSVARLLNQLLSLLHAHLLDEGVEIRGSLAPCANHQAAHPAKRLEVG